MILERIQKENDIKELSDEELKILASEIRQFNREISDTVTSASIWRDRLTMALHLFLDLPKDKLDLECQASVLYPQASDRKKRGI